MAVISVRGLDHYRALESVARQWAKALDHIHTQVFIGPGPHPEKDAFEALEKRLRDLALDEG